jgi:enoyl-CoA hydratase
MARQFVQVKIEDHIAVVTLNRPPVNAFTREMYQETADTFEELSNDREVRVAILTGAGEKAFCAGNDISEFKSVDPEAVASHNLLIERCFRVMHHCTIPLIGAVNGHALGTGTVLCGVCDFLVASPNATFGIPEITVGTIGGGRYIMRLVPQQKARWLAFSGERISAEEMYRLGAVEKVVSREELLPTALAMARRIVAVAPPAAIRLEKQALNDMEFLNLEEGHIREHHYAGQLRGTPDAVEAARAFFEKRPPQFIGS